MGLSSRLFLLSGDDTLHSLASTAFMRMLRQEEIARLPDFTGQRVRLASLVVELSDRTPLRAVRRSFCVELKPRPWGAFDVVASAWSAEGLVLTNSACQ